jgi:hypothetical protein
LNCASSAARAFAEVAAEVAHVLEVVIGGESVAAVAEEGMVPAAIVIFLAGAEMAELTALKHVVVPQHTSAAELADAGAVVVAGADAVVAGAVAAVVAAAAAAEEPQLGLAKLEHLHNVVVGLAEVRLEADPALEDLALEGLAVGDLASEDLACGSEERDDVVEEAGHYSGCT